MLVVMASLDGSTSVETLLVAIHLERYLDAFRRGGLLLARDFTHRTMSLGQPRYNRHWTQEEDPNDYPITFEAFRNSSAPDLAAMLTNSDSGRPVVKPVPKPRTVFNRRRTAPIHFCPTPDPATAPTQEAFPGVHLFHCLRGFDLRGHTHT
ncbi:hypothetical protein GBF38_009303 [Nibea albiflora]|uniref:Uncharacterized protein n=1 Tax=Nibea albiflora TaxID=240163 RepID=A0ACB7EQJ4_NIBAL|nr:hypothetical protein GBF38_009303 [Nibea albiflora]